MRDWQPKLVDRTQPVAQPQPAAVVRAQPKIVKEDAPPRPKGWRFVPERDANNLIIEIIATPIY